MHSRVVVAIVALAAMTNCSFLRTSLPPPSWTPSAPVYCETSSTPPIVDAVIGGLAVFGVVGSVGAAIDKPPPAPSVVGIGVAMGGIAALESVAMIFGLHRTAVCRRATSEHAMFVQNQAKQAEVDRIARWSSFAAGTTLPTGLLNPETPTLVSTLLDDWSNNEVRAMETWHLKRLWVVGRITKVFAGESGGPYFSIVSEGTEHELAFGALFCRVPMELARKLEPKMVVALDGVLTPSKSLFARHSWHLAGCTLLPSADEAMKVLCSERPEAAECHR